MRNLWIFLNRYNAFFLFGIFFICSVILLLRNNSYQKASTLNSSNQVVGEAYRKVGNLKDYLSLGIINDSLASENARLKNMLKTSFYNDSIVFQTVKDTLLKQQYTYIVAKVINNSVHRENNYITVNRGSRHGIKKGMGVLGPNGIVGIIRNVSPNFSTIQSLLHSESRFSVSVDGNVGSLIWGDNNFDPRIATLKDIPNHIIIKKGAKVLTSGYSLLPTGIPVGVVSKTEVKGGDSFLDMEVRLSTDFTTLKYVYVVNNLFAEEQKSLEDSTQQNNGQGNSR